MTSYEDFYRVVRSIPEGRVSSYGVIARLAGLPEQARQVGYALAALPHGSDVPWHRVVNARGEVSARKGGSASEKIQRLLLENEGIVFDEHGRLDMMSAAWPDVHTQSREDED